uniref:Bm13213 n=1 Tax=Brugia malayi TaxID=6279 RepID=A0A1I9G5U7_BRUMA|nr:Bm13213 [Brugia malayi]
MSEPHLPERNLEFIARTLFRSDTKEWLVLGSVL